METEGDGRQGACRLFATSTTRRCAGLAMRVSFQLAQHRPTSRPVLRPNVRLIRCGGRVDEIRDGAKQMVLLHRPSARFWTPSPDIDRRPLASRPPATRAQAWNVPPPSSKLLGPRAKSARESDSHSSPLWGPRIPFLHAGLKRRGNRCTLTCQAHCHVPPWTPFTRAVLELDRVCHRCTVPIRPACCSPIKESAPPLAPVTQTLDFDPSSTWLQTR